MPDFTVAFTDAPESVPPSPVTFNPPLPAGLSGAFLRNGPGIQHVGSQPQHFLDGYGYVASLRLADGKATLIAKHIESSIWKKERGATTQLQRKPFTNLPGRLANVFKLNLANSCTHDVYMWGGKVVASDAPGHYLLDPLTLDAAGSAPLNVWSKMPGSGPPMPRIDPATRRLVTYFVKPGLGSSKLELKELDEHWNPVHSVTGTIPGPGSFLHDVAFSPHWVAIAEFGRLNPLKAIAGGSTVYDALDPGSQDLRLLLFDRQKGGEANVLTVPHPHQAFHLPNLWEDGEVVELLAITYGRSVDFRSGYPPGMERPGVFFGPNSPTMVRHRYLPRTKEHTATRLEGPVLEAPCVNPAFFGKKNRFVWGPTPGTAGDEEDPSAYFWFHGLCRFDLEHGRHQSFDFGPRTYVSPPAFAQKPGTTGEDEGWLLSWVTDAATRKSGVVVLDAAHIDQGPISRGDFDVLLPAVSHSEFVESSG